MSVTLLIGQHGRRKLVLEMRKAELQAEQVETFTRDVQARGSQRLMESLGKQSGMMEVVRMLEETASNQSVSEHERAFCEEIMGRVKDMARGLQPI